MICNPNYSKNSAKRNDSNLLINLSYQVTGKAFSKVSDIKL